MSQVTIERVPFGLVGEFLGFILDKQDQPRRLRLMWLGQEIMIKVEKYLRDDRYDGWIPGMQIEVWGTQQFSKKKTHIKFNAHRMSLRSGAVLTVNPVVKNVVPSRESVPTRVVTNAPITIVTSNPKPAIIKPAIIKVCGKPDCMKQGGKALCKTLDKALSSGEWDPSIQIQFTGCMGKCSQGPNLVVMPDKKRYSNVTAQDIPKVLTQHFNLNNAVL